MNKALRIYILFSVFAGTSIYILQKQNVQLPRIINNYVNDFLIIPIILFISLHLLKWSKNSKNYTLPLALILYLCLLYSILFEFILPNYLARYTKDYIDIIAYFAGGFVFYFLQKIKK